MRQLPEFVLTLGADATGKSSFIDSVSDTLGYVALEPTSSPEAKAFKIKHLHDPIDIALVQKRRNLFRGLNMIFDETVRAELKQHRVITTGHRLITDISHAVMGKLVGGGDYSMEHIIDAWREDTPLVPLEIVFLHAPITVIRDRIQARLENGDAAEQMTGFNSLHYLAHYQQALSDATEVLSTDIQTRCADTSIVSVELGLTQFTS